MQRTYSGFLFVVIIVGAIALNQYLFVTFFSIICGYTLYEFHQLTNNQTDVYVQPYVAFFLGIILFVSSFLYAAGLANYLVFFVYALSLVLLFIAELYQKHSNPIHNLAYLVFGQVFVAVPFAMLNTILFINGYQPLWLLSILVIIWMYDTGAFLVGLKFGRHRLFERISPQKSWEGFWGGFIFAVGAGYVFSLFLNQINPLLWCVLAMIIAVLSALGDLLESLIKRTIQVKDSGSVLPGHGGLLDRLDSMLLVVPFVYIFLSVVLPK